MSEDKVRDILNDLEGKTKQSDPSSSQANANSNPEDFKTREMNMEEIAERVRMEKERQAAESGQPAAPAAAATPQPPAPPEDIEEVPLELPPEAMTENAGAENGAGKSEAEAEGKSEEDDEPIKITEEEYESLPVERLPEMTAQHPSLRKGISSTTRGLAFVVAVLLAVMLYFMFRHRQNVQDAEEAPVPAAEETTTGDVQEQDPSMVTESLAPPDTTPPLPMEKKAPQFPVVELPYDSLQGAAPLTVKEDGAVISEEVDPEIAAIVDAMKVRVQLLHGSRVKQRGNVETHVTSGKFHGFKIISTHQTKDGEVIRDDVVLTTPSRGTVVTDGHILVRMKKTDADRLRKELVKAGVDVIKNIKEEDGLIEVQLRMTKPASRKPDPAFVIGEDHIGSIKLGLPLDKMMSLLPSKKYMVIEKKMLVEDDYYNTFKVYDSRKKPLFFVIENEGKVAGIQVLHNKYKTGKGIGLGSTLAQLKLYYLKNETLRATSTATGNPYVSIGKIQGKFFIKGEGVDPMNKVFPDNCKIATIILGSSPWVK